LAGITGFNKENAKRFYDKISEVLSRHPLDESKIRNMDETGITPVLKKNCRWKGS
jgi:hypothetical protein